MWSSRRKLPPNAAAAAPRASPENPVISKIWILIQILYKIFMILIFFFKLEFEITKVTLRAPRAWRSTKSSEKRIAVIFNFDFFGILNLTKYDKFEMFKFQISWFAQYWFYSFSQPCSKIHSKVTNNLKMTKFKFVINWKFEVITATSRKCSRLFTPTCTQIQN